MSKTKPVKTFFTITCIAESQEEAERVNVSEFAKSIKKSVVEIVSVTTWKATDYYTTRIEYKLHNKQKPRKAGKYDHLFEKKFDSTLEKLAQSPYCHPFESDKPEQPFDYEAPEVIKKLDALACIKDDTL